MYIGTLGALRNGGGFGILGSGWLVLVGVGAPGGGGKRLELGRHCWWSGCPRHAGGSPGLVGGFGRLYGWSWCVPWGYGPLMFTQIHLPSGVRGGGGGGVLDGACRVALLV